MAPSLISPVATVTEPNGIAVEATKQSWKSTNGHSSTIQHLVDELRSSLKKSKIVTRDSEDYKESIKRWSDAVEREAAVIVFVTSAEDVSTTLVLCQKYKVETVVSGGKHSSGGASSTTGGLVIDLAEMRKVAVNAESKTLTVQGGAVWKDVDEAAANYGLATVGGTVNHTGVGGLTLGGGYGWLSGRYGLAIDNLLRATIVLADGRIITASETLHPDLFWAVRGAGQCFGVVVEFVFQAFDQVEPVWAGQMVYLAHKSLDSLVQFANSFVERNDPDAGLVLGITAPPMLKELALVASVFYNGPEEKAKAIFEPLIKIGPIVNNVRVRPYVEVNGLLNHAVPYGGSKLSKGASFIAPLSPAFMRTVLAGLEALHTEIPETKKSILNLEFYSPDQWCRVPLTATAFANRGRHQNALIGPFWSDRKDDIAVRLWARHMAGVFVAELNRVQKESRDPKQMSIVTEYGNYDCLMATPKAVFGVNIEKLRELKAIYDPSNVFHSSYDLSRSGDCRV